MIGKEKVILLPILMANHMVKTAIVIGATGLVGRNLVLQLLEDESIEKVKIFVRRSTKIKNAKLSEHFIDFEKIEEAAPQIHGDVLFSCLGTTIKQAGSKDVQYRIDFYYQYEFARIAALNGVSDYVLVSSAGANSKSKVFYSRMKGELEESVEKLDFSRRMIIQPSVLMGHREQERKMEVFAGKLMQFLKIVPFLKKYRGIQGSEVAQAMLNIWKTQNSKGTQKYVLGELFHYLDQS